MNDRREAGFSTPGSSPAVNFRKVYKILEHLLKFLLCDTIDLCNKLWKFASEISFRVRMIRVVSLTEDW